MQSVHQTAERNKILSTLGLVSQQRVVPQRMSVLCSCDYRSYVGFINVRLGYIATFIRVVTVTLKHCDVISDVVCAIKAHLGLIEAEFGDNIRPIFKEVFVKQWHATESYKLSQKTNSECYKRKEFCNFNYRPHLRFKNAKKSTVRGLFLITVRTDRSQRENYRTAAIKHH